MMDLQSENLYIKWEVKKDLERFSAAGNPCVCRKGCSACCKLHKIQVMPEEVEYIVNLQLDIDMDRLKRQNENWEKADKTCVFLKDEACMLHDDGKPLSCITHNVLVSSDRCKTGRDESFIHTKDADSRVAKLFRKHGTVKLHEELYKKLSS